MDNLTTFNREERAGLTELQKKIIMARTAKFVQDIERAHKNTAHSKLVFGPSKIENYGKAVK